MTIRSTSIFDNDDYGKYDGKCDGDHHRERDSISHFGHFDWRSVCQSVCPSFRRWLHGARNLWWSALFYKNPEYTLGNLWATKHVKSRKCKTPDTEARDKRKKRNYWRKHEIQDIRKKEI